ncbi:hypothetical protein U1E44_08665 [Arenibacter sp. GZD96]|uniref:hypothetical protein n=1 Tax=Aurantibrevibacter litoralis TaxID=3106030 RepID=UPI002AFE6014|nr:hypothetical protein [Arenibacter sp. GZD-96]MEA1786160.1 hypothetical protein [Arenibacter sp. GZD-96]
MIKFFRKIRKNLLQEGKTTKYFKYAIVEIMLLILKTTVSCPVRDNLLVDKINTASNHRAVRYGILYNVPACRDN